MRQVKFVEVPAGAKPGDRVSFEGLPVEPPATAKQVEKKKIAEQVGALPCATCRLCIHCMLGK